MFNVMSEKINTWNNRMGDIQGQHQKCYDNVERGDLSSWEYLTATYDDEQFFVSDHSSIQGSDQQLRGNSVSTNRKNISTRSISKQSLSDAISYGELYETIDISKRRMTHSTSNPDLLKNNQLLHHFLENKVSSQRSSQKRTATAQSFSIDPTRIRVNSWSHPIQQNQDGLSSAHITAWHQEYSRSSNLMSEHDMISSIPAHPLMSNMERTERSNLTTELFDDHHHNVYRNNISYEPSASTQLSFTSLTVARGNDINLGEQFMPMRNKQFGQSSSTGIHLSKLASQVNQFDTSERSTYQHENEYVSHLVNHFESTQTTSKQDLPSTKKLTTIAHQVTVNDCTIVPDEVNAIARAETPHSSSRRRAAAKKVIVPCFSPMEEQLMHTWMTLQDPSMIPPYQQLRSKKLLLAPLTPYNYFFRDERENIVIHISNEFDPLPPPIAEFSVLKMKSLLYQHWFIDPVKKKRQHRKSHGKINFHRLSKVIAERWCQLPSQIREFYRAVARYDDKYYHQHLDIIKQSPDIER